MCDRVEYSDRCEVDKFESIRKDFADVINRHSAENDSNTLDWILADYLVSCLKAFNSTSRAREKWYGKSLSINGEPEMFHNIGEIPANS